MLFAMPLAAFAQVPQNMMDPAKMQQMMQQMQTMQACMQNIDPSEMRAMEQRGRALEKELKMLCARGERDAAQDAAMRYAMETAKNPALQEMKKCGEQMMQYMPKLPYQDMASDDNGEHSGHVCDSVE